MKKERLILNCGIIFIIFLLGIFANSISISAEEFKSCSQNSDCKVDVCNENSCVNQSSSILECNPSYFAAKECQCLNNVCSVLVGVSTPVCDANHPGITYCKDSKNLMTCDAGSWALKTCDNKCENGACTPEETTVSTNCQNQVIKCQDGTISPCKLINNECVCSTCPSKPSPIQQTNSCTDSDDGNFYEKGFMKGAADDSGHTDLCGDSHTLTEYYCENNEARKTTFNCPNGCKDGACIKKGEEISEKIICGFKSSDKEEKCHIAGSFNDGDDGTKFCKGIGTCIIDYKGYKGEKLTWKSSCGGYQYTIQDGNDEKIEFECTSGKTSITQIQNRGFRNAYWQCYDKVEEKQGEETSCKTSETWQGYAKKFCDGHCYQDNSKCGVNSFSVMNECYIEEEIAIPKILPVEIIETEKTNETTTEKILVCKDSCPLDGKCYPFGYRKSGKYCSDNGGFVEQLTSENQCDNNFECSSNICVSGKCISEGFIQKILNLFKKLFSGD